jgi:hypothetical protein
MCTHDRVEICQVILRNAGIEEYCLADEGCVVLIDPHPEELTVPQRFALRAADAVLAGLMEPEAAVALGLA